jgi:hypothetical protein
VKWKAYSLSGMVRLREGYCLLSVHVSAAGEKSKVVLEANRPASAVLMPRTNRRNAWR